MEALSDIQKGGTSAFLPGGSASISQVTVNIPYDSEFHASVVVSVPGMTAATKLLAALAGEPDTAENAAEDIADWEVVAEPRTDEIAFHFYAPGPFGGPVKINYLAG